METRTTILLADDHEVVRAGLRDGILRGAPNLDIVEAASLDETIALTRTADPRLILFDLYMPGSDGPGSIAAVRAAAPDVPLAVISGTARHRDVEDVMAAGAAGFVPKTMRLEAIVSAIRLMLAGERYLPYEHLRRNAEAAHDGIGLTRREREIVEAISRGQANRQIARALGLEEVTVKLHASHAYRKLGVANRTQAAMKAAELGLV